MTPHDVAIVGMACVFPKAPDLATYWRNIRDGVDCITDVPAARWDPLYYDPKSTAPDRFYARRGGFIDDYATFDPAAFGVMPIAAKGAEPEQFLALQTAVAALSDAGYAERAFPRGRTNVILGRGNYLGPAMLRLVNVTRGAEQLLANLRQLVPALGAAELDAIKREFQKACGTYGPDTAIGLVPNLVASRIANRLDLGGAAYTIDAACASTLIAVDQACRQLGSGLADMALCGGVHLCQDPAFWSVFTQLGALSRSEQIRPFDEHADGLLIGEGLGMVVLKRLADARADGDRIYAVIRGSGTASDGRDVSLMTPRVDGQVLALTRAWQDAGIDPSRLGLLEAHGTGTPAGDAAEIETLARVFGPARSEEERIPIGSVKSMIGHTMPAAGAAGLIKTALAVYHGVRPPTLHCDAPNGALRNTRFRIATRAEPWDVALRCAAVNAFGFGGINAHVILESEDVRTAPVARGRSRAVPDAEHALLIAAPSQDALLEALAAGSSGGSGEWRAAILDPTPKRLAAARAAIASGRPRHGRDGIYFSPRGLLTQGGKIAFVFPGVEAAFAPRIDDIATHFNLPLPDLRASDLAYQGVSVGRLNMFMYRVMSELGCRPHAVAGHSIGEWCGMLACGMFGAVSVEQVLGVLKPGSLRIAEVTYIAAGAGAARLESIVRELPDVAISHDNCIHQSIVCAPEAQVEPLLERLRRERILYEVLPFRSGFHSSALAKHVDSFADNLARLPLHVANLPLWSATTCTPYPDAPADIAALFLRHLVEPVRFRELILAMYDDGVRVFVQLGTGSTMSFVDDVLLNRPHHAIPLVVAQRPGMDQLRRAGAALFVEGASLDLARIGLMKPGAAPREAHPMKLELGVPLIRLEHAPLIQPTSSPALRPESSRTLATTAHNAVLDQFDASLREIADAQQAVAQALAKLDKAPPATTRADERVDRLVLSVDTFPELIDHALIPQPNDWPDLADRAPAVPMTMSIALMREAAQRLDPQRVAVRVENVQANTWLYTEPALEVDMRAKR
ncbi:MAG TPA: beta-ketoacyl synthase N-terminal-like domain-containing protein, partial [Casimicrobiaceae bacterium]|nr:beta-ketoacyl synthase N-terminal-like domain-containing protein [Casimicrobiaceae bacterium]